MCDRRKNNVLETHFLKEIETEIRKHLEVAHFAQDALVHSYSKLCDAQNPTDINALEIECKIHLRHTEEALRKFRIDLDKLTTENIGALYRGYGWGGHAEQKARDFIAKYEREYMERMRSLSQNRQLFERGATNRTFREAEEDRFWADLRRKRSF